MTATQTRRYQHLTEADLAEQIQQARAALASSAPMYPGLRVSLTARFDALRAEAAARHLSL